MMGLKRGTILVNGEKIHVDVEKRTVTGPEHLMVSIRQANEELQGSDVTIQGYLDSPPGHLWAPQSLFPLLRYLFGAENVKWDESEPTEYYPEEPGIIY